MDKTLDRTLQEIVNEAVDIAISRHIDVLAQTALNDERLLSLKELSKLTGFTVITVRGWITRKRKPLPAYQVDRHLRVRLCEFREWIDRYRNVPRVDRIVSIRSA